MFEIMAMEKPIIGSVRGEAAEILKKSKGALVCEPENVEQLTKNIIFIHDNLNIQTSLGKKALSFVGRSFDREKLAKKYEKLFKSIIID
jgi:colanic acid biosynthesis glycosyl transferase WcaI